MPAQENGFENKYYNVTKDEFVNAYNIANKIISTFNSNKEDYYEFIIVYIINIEIKKQNTLQVSNI